MRALWEVARTYVGVPWLAAGRSMSGVDCMTLTVLCMEARGVLVDPGRVLSHRTTARDAVRVLALFFERRPVSDAAPGDVVVWHMSGGAHQGVLAPGAPLNVIFARHKDRVVEEPFGRDVLRVKNVWRPWQT